MYIGTSPRAHRGAMSAGPLPTHRLSPRFDCPAAEGRVPGGLGNEKENSSLGAVCVGGAVRRQEILDVAGLRHRQSSERIGQVFLQIDAAAERAHED